MWRWSACAFSQMGILLLEYTEGADHPLQLPYRVEVEGYPYVHGGRWGWSAHLGLSDQHPSDWSPGRGIRACRPNGYVMSQ